MAFFVVPEMLPYDEEFAAGQIINIILSMAYYGPFSGTRACRGQL